MEDQEGKRIPKSEALWMEEELKNVVCSSRALNGIFSSISGYLQINLNM